MRRLSLLLAACGGAPSPQPPRPVAPPVAPAQLRVIGARGEPIAGALLTVSDHDKPRLALVTDSHGEFVLPGAGDVGITAVSPTGDGWAFEPHFATKPPGELRLQTSDCEVLAGTVRTSTMPAALSFGRLSDATGDVFTIAVAPDGRFHACLPPGAYASEFSADVRSSELFAHTPATDLELAFESRATVEQDATKVAGITGERAKDFVAGLPAATEVFAIAESNHGSREFITERLALTLALANQRGVRLVMFEAGYAEVIALDDYINDVAGSSDITGAVEKLGYWVWDTKTFLAALTDLRTANRKRAAKDRLHLLGFDMQDTEAAIPQLVAAHAIDAAIVPVLQRLVDKDGIAWKQMTEADRAPVIAALSAVAARRDDKGITSSVNRLALAAHQLVLRLHALEPTDSWSKLAMRDRGMAELTLDILSRSSVPRAALWAHLGHLARTYVIGAPAMGDWLARTLGSRYQVFAMLAGGGSARAWDHAQAVGVVPRELPAPPPFALEAMLGAHRIGPVTYFRFAAATGAAATWLAGLHPVRDFGSVHPAAEKEFRALDLRGIDGAILIDEVHPTEPTPTGERHK